MHREGKEKDRGRWRLLLAWYMRRWKGIRLCGMELHLTIAKTTHEIKKDKVQVSVQ